MLLSVRALRPFTWARVRNLGTVTTTAKASPTPSKTFLSAEVGKVSIQTLNSRLDALALNASYLSGRSLLAGLPGVVQPKLCPSLETSSSTVLTDPILRRAPLVEPESVMEKVAPELPSTAVPKMAAKRMLRIRKRKMKVHQRRKRRKAQAARIRKVLFNRVRTKEVSFRATLSEHVRAAKEFDAAQYVDAYLQDLDTKITPQTFEGRRHPTWLVEQLEEKKRLEKRRREEEKLDLITGEPLVREGETVEQFVKRMEEREKAR